MKKLIHLIWFAALGCACEADMPPVENFGELRAIMHQGAFEARVAVDSLEKKNLYALGALDSLRGEVLIKNGKVFTATVDGAQAVLAKDEAARATLLVRSYVTSWDTLELRLSDDLEIQLEKVAAERSIEEAFPFILIGTPTTVDYHVINFDAANGDISRHKEGALKAQLVNESVWILGFHSKSAKGIYTHHDSDVHMHVLDADETRMGHVDGLVTGDGMFQLLIPAK